jgi:uncharacterized glyoxalase superfamily protein PhnB
MPVLRVTDLARSVDFYRDVLGFTPAPVRFDEADTPFVTLHWEPVALLLTTGAHLGPGPAFSGTLYLHVVGVETLYNRVKGRAEMVWPLEDMNYGTREFGVRDPDGYVIAFAEELPEPRSEVTPNVPANP